MRGVRVVEDANERLAVVHSCGCACARISDRVNLSVMVVYHLHLRKTDGDASRPRC